MPSHRQTPSRMATANVSPIITSGVTGFELELDPSSVVSREKICGKGAIFQRACAERSAWQ